MSDRDALLRAIAANPDDDTPRLIYADLLDELGGHTNTARARFIRLQIETHRETDDRCTPYDDPEYCAPALDEAAERALAQKRAEAEQLANRYSGAWLAELPTWCNPMFGLAGMTRVNLFARGFVERVTARTKSFVQRADELLDSHPIREIELQGGSSKLLPALFEYGELTRLRSLAFDWPEAPPELASALAGCPLLLGLTALDLSECKAGDAEARALAQSVCLPALRMIRLGSSVTLAGVRLLATSVKLGNLKEIDVRACRPWVYVTGLSEEFPGKTFHGWNGWGTES